MEVAPWRPPIAEAWSKIAVSWEYRAIGGLDVPAMFRVFV
jgi:hypothetical protein